MADQDVSYLAEYYHKAVWNAEAATQFFLERGLRHSIVERFRLGYVPGGYHRGRLSIPYFDGMYRVRGIRYRWLPGAGQPDKKYLGQKGSTVHVFAPRASNEAVVPICEGEADCMTLWGMGIKAVGIPGANVWQEHWSLMFRNCDAVILAFDPDAAGERGGHKVARSLTRYGVEVRMAELPKGEDINSLYVNAGASRVREVLGV